MSKRRSKRLLLTPDNQQSLFDGAVGKPPVDILIVRGSASQHGNGIYNQRTEKTPVYSCHLVGPV